MNQNLVEDLFLKDILSFMNESIDSRGNSEHLSGKRFANYVATRNSFPILTDKKLVYRRCNFSNRLYTTWSTFSAGSIPSIRESIPTNLSKKLSSPTNPWSANSDQLINLDKIISSCLEISPAVTDKTQFFKKCLKASLLPEMENHPDKVGLLKDNNNYNFFGNKPKSATKESPYIFKEKTTLDRKTVLTEKFIVPFETKTYQICKFCRKNGEPEIVYTGHLLKVNGIITCPILRRHICDLCGATGNYSHTRKYCPLYEEPLAQLKYKKFVNNNSIMTFNLSHK